LLFDNLRPKSWPAPPEGAGDQNAATGPRAESRDSRAGSVHAADALAGLIDLGDAPTCSFCGSIMTRNGSCYRCMSCGSTSGCS
jgi:ribonucleoside-diphosphate reductase alpha chain